MVNDTAAPTVTVWSDIGCPWASLALHTLHAAAERRQVALAIDHRAFPLELFNREPTPKFIVDPEVQAIAAHRPELGWRLWNGPAHAYPVTTLPALEAVQPPRTPGSADCAEATSWTAPSAGPSTPTAGASASTR